MSTELLLVDLTKKQYINLGRDFVGTRFQLSDRRIVGFIGDVLNRIGNTFQLTTEEFDTEGYEELDSWTEEMLDKDEKDFDAYYFQERICGNCNKEIKLGESWCTEDQKAPAELTAVHVKCKTNPEQK